MDNHDFRRDKLTNHQVFGEGIYWVEIVNPQGSATTEPAPSFLEVFP
jgi:hypothetical protein